MPEALDLDLQPARYDAKAFSYGYYMTTFGLSKAQAKQAVKRVQLEKVWRSSTHQVAVTPTHSPALGPGQWLSIKTLEKAPISDRTVLARLMRKLVPGYGGFELLPAPSRLVDSANQYHLWTFPETAMPELAGLDPALEQSKGGWRAPWFEGQELVELRRPAASDWRELYLWKESSWPGQEAALFWGSAEGVGADGWVIVLPRRGATVAHFPFGFRERLVAGPGDDADRVGYQQRALPSQFENQR